MQWLQQKKTDLGLFLMLISLFCIGAGLCLTIGWFDHSLQAFTHLFLPTDTKNQKEETIIHPQSSSQLITTSGHIQSLMDIKGEVTLLSFWASWCGPCRVELPTLATLHNKFKDKGLRIVAINMDGDTTNSQEIASFWETLDLPFSFFSDFEGTTSKAFNVKAIPAHFILNQNGEITITANGANDWSHPRNLQMIEDLFP